MWILVVIIIIAIAILCSLSSRKQDKLLAAVLAGIMFFALSNGNIYALTNTMSTALSLPPMAVPSPGYSGVCPTLLGTAVHSVLFTLLVYLVMIN
jgi:hypothetical protein